MTRSSPLYRSSTVIDVGRREQLIGVVPEYVIGILGGWKLAAWMVDNKLGGGLPDFYTFHSEFLQSSAQDVFAGL
jgi:hypothetical protein